MRHTPKLAILLVSLVICSLLPAGSRTPARVATPARVTAVRNDEAPSELRIFVEAFVVQVKLPKLYEMGVCPLGSEVNPLSAEHVAQCLKEGGAEIICGAKVSMLQNEQGTVEEKQKETTRKTTHTRISTSSSRSTAPKNEGQSTPRSTARPRSTDASESKIARTLPPPPTRSSTASARPMIAKHSTANTVLRGKSFSATARVVRHGISVDFSFDVTTEDQDQPGEDFVSYERELTWKSSVYLKPGKPQIVGATQEGQEAIFLILTANIED